MKECPYCAELIKYKAIKCRFCGSNLADQPGNIRLAGSSKSKNAPDAVKKIATVVFADLSGFTKLSAQMEAEEVRDIMNALFSDLAGAVERFGGKIDKYIGDCVMAVWGADAARDDDAWRAANAALSMLVRIKNRARRLNLPLSIHIGVNTGNVVFGVVGAQDNADLTVIGEAVNLASRLCGAAPKDCVYVGEETWKRIAGKFSGEPRQLNLKGIGAITGYHIHAGARTHRTVAHVDKRFFHRDRELRLIESELSKLQRGIRRKTGGIIICGGGGLGKSRLAAQALERFAGGTKILFAQGVPAKYPAFAGLAAGWIGGLMGGTDQASIDRAFGKHRNLGKYKEAVGLLFADDDGGTGRNITGKLENQLAGFIAAMAQTQKIVLAAADIQWADRVSIDLCRVLAAGNNANIMLLLDAQPGENVERLRSDKAFAIVNLSHLSRQEVAGYLGSIIKGDVPGQWVARVYERTRGVFLHLNQIIDCLAEQKLLQPDPGSGRFVLTCSENELPVPAALADLVWHRIERLPSDSRELLMLASICGLRFPHDLLPVATGKPAGELRRALEILFNNDFLRETREELYFEHGSKREVARSMLLKKERSQIAGNLIDNLGDRIWQNEYRQLAPEWLGAAGRTDELSHYYAMEAYRLIRSWRLGEAKAMLARISPGSMSDSRAGHKTRSAHLNAQSRLAECEHRLDDAYKYARQALAVLKKLGDARALSNGYILLGRMAIKFGKLDDAVEMIARALELSKSIGDAKGVDVATFMLGFAAEQRRDWDAALGYFKQTLRSERRKSGIGRAYALSGISRMLEMKGNIEKATAYAIEALACLTHDEWLVQNPHVYGLNLIDAGRLSWRRQKTVGAVSYVEAALQLGRAVSHHDMVSRGCFRLAQMAADIRDYRPAKSFCAHAGKIHKIHANKAGAAAIKAVIDSMPARYDGTEITDRKISSRLKEINDSLDDAPSGSNGRFP